VQKFIEHLERAQELALNNMRSCPERNIGEAVEMACQQLWENGRLSVHDYLELVDATYSAMGVK
jgi:hypothetical protein